MPWAISPQRIGYNCRMTVNVQLTLNPNAVMAPALNALRDTLEVIAICFPSIDSTDTVPRLEGAGMDFRIEPNEPAKFEERRSAYKQWMLGKGFHELARGLRQSLEEAYLYIEVAKVGAGPMLMGELHERLAAIKTKANKADFPSLMESVNAGLTEKLYFEREFRSLIKTRNCLEHRHGIIGDRDVEKDTGTLTLSLPRMKVLFLEDGAETELAVGQQFGKDTEIFMKRVTTETRYNLGDKITFSADEFKIIAFGCWCFVQDLVGKLPKLPSAKANA